MPTLLKIFGLRFFFYSAEHEPVHIHVENADGMAKFDIQDGNVSLTSNDGLKPKDLKLAESIVEENKTIFEHEWIKYFGKEK
ncbi:DUF4160 domain-containing protein [Fibrobacter sp. UWEL]|uniref:DUF4160 domain-containing protein n=1 Tax=Fibrobacter sp. UWEL TaxID=1896209 RepID=UPI00092355A8|nr:DUF4160 domain-containing protein [Fibrobacter sp. UWEL]SHK63984.1 protein of unknown function [Fibrobacter sp. UWEL]